MPENRTIVEPWVGQPMQRFQLLIAGLLAAILVAMVVSAVLLPMGASRDFVDVAQAVGTVGAVVVALVFGLRGDSLATRNAEMGQKQVRAYLYPLTLEGWHHADLGPVIRVRVKNFGSTPARVLDAWAGGIHLADKAMADTQDWKRPATLPSLAGHQSIGSGETSEHFITVAQSLVDDAMASTPSALFCWGEFHYRDVFDQPHVTRFRYQLSASPNFVGCIEGNEAT